jgi:histidine triad (HIT) family protein
VSDCLFCKIARKEIPAQIVFDGEDVVAFNDVRPQAPVHVLIIPKKHVAHVLDLSTGDAPILGKIHRAVNALADLFSVRESGFRLVVNTGADAGQSVAHLHCHFLAGRPLSWPPG